jgi:hypothetical protein
LVGSPSIAPQAAPRVSFMRLACTVHFGCMRNVSHVGANSQTHALAPSEIIVSVEIEILNEATMPLLLDCLPLMATAQ